MPDSSDPRTSTPTPSTAPARPRAARAVALVTALLVAGTGLMLDSAGAATRTTPTTAPASSTSLITAARPGSIVLVARGYGTAELTKDSAGDPRIEGRMNGIFYVVHFFGCENGRNCRDIQFAAAFTDLAKKPTIKLMNDWNRQFRYGQAWLDDEGDPNIAIVVELNGGTTKANLDAWFRRWNTVLSDFVEHIGFR